MRSISIAAFFVLATWRPFVWASCPAVEDCLSREKLCSILPVPNAQPILPFNNYTVKPIRPGVFSFSEPNIISLIIFKNDQLVLVDAPLTVSSFTIEGDYKLLLAVNDLLRRGPRHKTPSRIHLVYGHRHTDHIGGMAIMHANLRKWFPKAAISIWGTGDTDRVIARARTARMPPVTRLVGRKGCTIHVAPTLQIRLMLFSGHVREDMGAFIPASGDGAGIFHIADFITPGFSPAHRFSQVGDFDLWVESQERFLKLDFSVLSSGHLRLGDKHDIRMNIRYAKDALKFSREAVQEITPQVLDEAGFALVADPSTPQYRNAAFLLQTSVDLQVKICKRKLIQKYGCLLGGVAEFADSQCAELYFFLNISTFPPF